MPVWERMGLSDRDAGLTLSEGEMTGRLGGRVLDSRGGFSTSYLCQGACVCLEGACLCVPAMLCDCREKATRWLSQLFSGCLQSLLPFAGVRPGKFIFAPSTGSFYTKLPSLELAL